jgi:chromate reductase, NAD(P)H dehydrogenase (quinone)
MIMQKDSKKKLLAISGSTRKESSNGAILNYMAEAYGDALDIEIYEQIDQLPHFSPDLDKANVPAAVDDFRNRIRVADGVLICTPEYVFSLPGCLKNAIEWNVSTTLFSNKQVAIIVAAGLGEKAYESLELIMTTIESRLEESSKLLIRGIKGKVGPSGEIKDQDTAHRIRAVVDSLIKSMHAKNERPTKYQSFMK